MLNLFVHNFNKDSNSGPNKFTRQLLKSMKENFETTVVSNSQEADVEFCLIQQSAPKVKPMLLRLDGIWFNSDQDYKRQNLPIRYAFRNANAVVYQSEFNKALTESWFGVHPNGHVIHNAPDFKLIRSANKRFWNKMLGEDTEVWSCASNWRPHKRLYENIRYFLDHAPTDAILAIAGGIPMDEAKSIYSIDKRIVLLGDLDYISLLCLYKRSSTFLHLSYLDHCPNVVVDAQASGCHIVCSSTGGTSELVYNGTIIQEKAWDFKPTKLYEPPPINFNYKKFRYKHNQGERNKYSILDCAEKYYKLLKEIK